MRAVDLPQQPEIVREWIRRSRNEERRADALMLGQGSARDPFDIIGRVDDLLAVLTSAFVPPAEVAEAYEAWRIEYNAGVAKINAERQGRINAREAAKVRASACPRCYATHAGEC